MFVFQFLDYPVYCLDSCCSLLVDITFRTFRMEFICREDKVCNHRDMSSNICVQKSLPAVYYKQHLENKGVVMYCMTQQLCRNKSKVAVEE